ncbi:MAG: isoleucine--tRNA ligase, partial [Deltaproteobacteria bacterium]|nr:isoleucine--tRNA ligase [Deltaproteobacteria bacterium]
NSLEARVELKAKGRAAELLKRYQEQLADIFIVSQVSLNLLADNENGSNDHPELKIEVKPASGNKCKRCWCYSEELTTADAEFPDICPKCLLQVI